MAGILSSLPLLSVAGIVSGIAVALHAQRGAARQRCEGIAGLLLTLGLLLVGFGLPVFR